MKRVVDPVVVDPLVVVMGDDVVELELLLEGGVEVGVVDGVDCWVGRDATVLVVVFGVVLSEVELEELAAEEVVVVEVVVGVGVEVGVLGEDGEFAVGVVVVGLVVVGLVVVGLVVVGLVVVGLVVVGLVVVGLAVVVVVVVVVVGGGKSALEKAYFLLLTTGFLRCMFLYTGNFKN